MLKSYIMISFIVSVFCIFSLMNSVSAQPLSIEELWVTQPEFSQPESVLYNPQKDVFYISNIAGTPNEKNGMGFISIISSDGKTIEKKWIEDLNAPKGMAIFSDTLYVSDIDNLVEIDIENGTITNRHNASDSIFLNDVTVDNEGNVFVSDMLTNTIYQLHQGKLKPWIQDKKLENPNGIIFEDNKLIVASWGANPDKDFTTNVPSHLKVINFADKSILNLGKGDPIGNLDGLRSDGNGNYYATDWMDGALLFIDSNGNFQKLLDLNPGSADLEAINDRNMIIIPMMNNNIVTAYKISQDLK